MIGFEPSKIHRFTRSLNWLIEDYYKTAAKRRTITPSKTRFCSCDGDRDETRFSAEVDSSLFLWAKRYLPLIDAVWEHFLSMGSTDFLVKPLNC